MDDQVIARSMPLQRQYPPEMRFGKSLSTNQWRSEGLQRQGANAWSGAPPPRLVNPASAPGEKKSTSKAKKKKKKKKSLQHEKVETQGDRGP